MTEIVLHDAYQQIIGMGELALPLILQELKLNNDHWFWALKAITGQDPTTEDMQGDIEALRNTWLDWARNNGFWV